MAALWSCRPSYFDRQEKEMPGVLLKNTRDLHPWTLDPAEAIRIQAALRERLTLEWDGRA